MKRTETWIVVGILVSGAVALFAKSAGASPSPAPRVPSIPIPPLSPNPSFGQGGIVSVVPLPGAVMLTSFGDGSALVVAPGVTWQVDTHGNRTMIVGTAAQADAITRQWPQ